MKNLIYLLCLCCFACQPDTSPQVEQKSIVFVGSYTQKEGHVDGKGAGVSIYESGPKAADWKLLHSFSDIINPSYICHSPKHSIIYAVSEQGPNVPEPKSVIKVIHYDPETYVMKELQSISALGHAPCYISTDRQGKFLLVANYVSGNVVQYSIKADGTLEPGQSSQHTGKGPHSRQEAPHAHYIKQHPNLEAVYAVDLGIDKVFKYKTGEAGLELLDSMGTNPGGGPRHLVWHPNGEVVYVLNELTGTIAAWNWGQNQQQHLQSISLKPAGDEGFAGSSDIHISKDGQFIYAALRGDYDELVVLQIAKDSGQLEVIQRVAAGGAVPRNFSLSPEEDYLAVASQNSDRIVLFARDKTTGLLGASSEVMVKTPVCVVYQ